MRFIHMADVHLGATPDRDKPWGKDRAKEIWESFEKVIEACNQDQIDLLLIAGDLFHKQPLVRELKEVNYLFTKLEKTEVILMAGNHDYIGPRSNYKKFKWDSKVHMFMKDVVEPIKLPKIKTVVHGLSYLTRDITLPVYDAAKPLPGDEIQILLAHGGDNKSIPINRKLLLNSGFDYIALGHIHIPEIISNKMAYAGSLEPLDRNETGERGYIIGEINEEKKLSRLEFIASARRQYKKLSLDINPDIGNLEAIDKAREIIKNHGEENIYQLIIEGFRDEAVEFDKEAILSLGNVLEIIDQSLPNYDFQRLYRENADNIIGLFIKSIKDKSQDEDVTKKALYYGLEALLDAKDQ